LGLSPSTLLIFISGPWKRRAIVRFILAKGKGSPCLRHVGYLKEKYRLLAGLQHETPILALENIEEHLN
jgi:hypothetical protein